MLSVPYLASLIRVVLDGTPFPAVDRAIPLLLGVAAQESGLRHTRQLGDGPARGFWQMEPATERDHWRWLSTHQAMRNAIQARCGVTEASAQALQHNLPYQILLARLHFYVRDPQALPEVGDVARQAACWKTAYNTTKGKGTVVEYINTWHRLIAPYWQAEERGGI